MSHEIIAEPLEAAMRRIESVYALMGTDLDVERLDLEDFLRHKVSEGEIDENKLAVEGLTFLKKRKS
jgi:hypothetical protein